MARTTSRLALGAAPAAALLALSGTALAQGPPGYYASVDDTNPATLRATLHAVIDDHQRFPYTSGGTDTWDILELAQEDPSNSSRIIDIYRNRSYSKIGGGTGPYNREHAWPKSYGFPNDSGTNYPFTDCHQLFLADASYNTERSNKPFKNCNSGCDEYPTDLEDGIGGGSGTYAGNSNWTEGSFTNGTWEVWADRRGDLARAMFYSDVRYEGGTHNVTGANEPNLILTDNLTLIDNSNTGSNESVAYMGLLSVLLQWHVQDPVDAREMMRNDVIYGFQGNRNPFVDHPEWVDCIFNGVCNTGDTTPPAAPTGLVLTPGDGSVGLNWNDNGEGDLAGYRVYRSTLSGGPYGEITTGLLVSSLFVDTGVVNGITYFYVVTAEDTSGNESLESAEEFATPMNGGGPTGLPWINELHYENSGPDVGEFVELAGPSGFDVSGWSLVLYNGSGGGTYFTLPLTGVFPDHGNCIGTLSFSIPGLQNGSPDGLALVDGLNQVAEFLSYEGSIFAVGGPASGMLSVDIGVSESDTTPSGVSLQLAGIGSSAQDFAWQSPQSETPGAPNAGQTFDACGGSGTGTPFCFGDGSGTACPCGNNSTSGHPGGCGNSSGDGAVLSATGDPSIANDTLSFSLTGATPFSLGVLFSGNNQLGGGNGILGNPPTDGLRCVGGGLLRHGNRSIGGTGANSNPWGFGAGPPGGIAAHGGFIAGQVRHFVVTYRDFDTLVCLTGLNTTNAISITFAP